MGLPALAGICHIIFSLLVCPPANADGIESGSTLQDAEQPAGNLRVVGKYLYSRSGHVVTALPNGKVLAYGLASVILAPNFGNQQRTMMLRRRDQHSGSGALHWEPQVWDSQLHGWKKIEQSPECKRGKPFLHTATVLPGSKILFSGGLCDEVRSANNLSPNLEYKKLSLWNGETEKWESAPVLEHGRVFHTASLLLDGSVLVVGGETDPAQVESGLPVLASVELYANGKVEQMPALQEARAEHTATVGAHGELLVVGGYDSAGQALASVEVWDPASREWHKVTPMNTARYSHSATLLEDGRILVAGGMGVEDRPLQSVEIWNPVSGEWTQSAILPRPVRDPGAILLDDGNLLLVGGRYSVREFMDTWAWLWNKSSGEWLPAGSSKPTDQLDLAYTPTFAKNSDGSVHIFSRQNILQWRPGAIAPASVPPQWAYHTPALALLDDGRVMTIGNIPQPGSSNEFYAHIWDPSSNTWSAAGRPAYSGVTRALQMPSGRVMHLGIITNNKMNNKMQCELWEPSDNSWRPCGEIQLKYVVESIGMFLLDDGRAVAITNLAEAHIFDESTLKWTEATQKWSDEVLPKGAPIWQNKPLNILTDENNREFDISAEAGRFMDDISQVVGSMDPHRRGTRPMLWDPAHKRWAYVGIMPSKARLLPDGCALSPYEISTKYPNNSFSLFQASTGLAGNLFNPGTGVNAYLAMEVLKDGTVVIAGQPEEADVTFFHRKASCAGWAAEADDWALMPGVEAKPVVAPAPANSLPAKIAPVTLRDRLLENRWLVLAVVGPVVLYVALRFIILPLVRRGLGRVMPDTVAKSLDRPVPKEVTSVMRFLVYGVLLVIGVPAALPHVFWLYGRTAEDCAATVCLNPENGLLRSVPSLEKDGAQPTVPCEYVGKWQSIGQNLHKERIILKDDGTYSTQPPTGHAPRTYTGYWMVQGNKMVWRHKEGIYSELDINHIVSHSETNFELIEQNGWHTRFNLIEKISSKICGQ